MFTVDVVRSPHIHKKYRAYFSNGLVVDFGSSNYDDYTLHKDEDRKNRYMKRHKRDLETLDVFKPGYLSWFVLWSFPEIQDSIDFYQKYVLNNDGEIITNPELYINTDPRTYEREMRDLDVPAFVYISEDESEEDESEEDESEEDESEEDESEEDESEEDESEEDESEEDESEEDESEEDESEDN
jgi:hypothetical protein